MDYFFLYRTKRSNTVYDCNLIARYVFMCFEVNNNTPKKIVENWHCVFLN